LTHIGGDTIPMGLLAINDLKDGMVLTQAVCNKHGNVLLQGGDTLDEKRIILLKSWGITEVDVKNIDGEQLAEGKRGELPPEISCAIEKEITELFPDCTGNPVMEKLYSIVTKFKMKLAVEQSVGNGKENRED